MTGRLRVVIWWALLLALALVCVWSAIDRLAGQGLLLRLPTPLLTGGNALAARATLATAAADVTGARALAAAAVRRRPVDAGALRMAGFAALAQGDARAGDALMRLAGTAGWRDAPTQLYWAEVALTGGALDVAAERLEAVERVKSDAASRALLLRLEATPAGRAALLRRWGEVSRWRAYYLADVGTLDTAGLVARVATVAAMRQAKLGVEQAVLDGLGWGLVARGRADLAYTLAGTDRPIRDFALATGDKPGPFAWTLAATAGLEASVERHGARLALHVVASGPALLPVASQLLRLPPGAALLSGAIEGAKTSLPLIATLDCVEGAGAAAEPAASAAGRFAARLTVPPGCATQRLTLSVAGEEARRGADLWLSDLAVTRGAPFAP